MRSRANGFFRPVEDRYLTGADWLVVPPLTRMLMALEVERLPHYHRADGSQRQFGRRL